MKLGGQFEFIHAIAMANAALFASASEAKGFVVSS